MLLTDVEVRVTDKMMAESNMTKGSKFGVPVEPLNLDAGLVWKELNDLTDDDFDSIEEFFINK